jgi:tetratricopeptide (TPR) repeat protein
MKLSGARHWLTVDAMTTAKASPTLAERYHLNDNGEWTSLLTHLDFADGFALIILLAPDGYGVRVCREALEKRFATENKRLHIIRIAIDEPPEKLAANVAKLPAAKVAAIWIQMERREVSVDNLLGIEPFDAAEREAFARALRTLNPERNQLRRNVSVPLIVAGPVWLQTVFRESAPDLWSIRNTVVNIQLSAHDLIDSSIGLQMPHEKHFAPPDQETESRAHQLRHDIKVLKNKPGRELLRAELLRRLGVELTNLLHWDEAEQILTEAYELHQDNHAPQPDLACAARDLGRLLRKKGELSRAKHYLEISLDAEKAAFGLDHGRYSRALTDLGSVLQDLGELEAAERFLRDALEFNERKALDSRGLSVDLSNLALLLDQTGRSKEAEPLYRRALAIVSKLEPPEPASEATIAGNLSNSLRKLGKLEEAEQLARHALVLTEESRGANHPDTAIRLANLALLLERMSRWSEAEIAVRRALMIDEKCYGKEHPVVALNLINLAAGLSHHGQAMIAEPFARRALATLAKWNRQNKCPHPNFDHARELYSSVLAGLGSRKSKITQRIRNISEGKKVRDLPRPIGTKKLGAKTAS